MRIAVYLCVYLTWSGEVISRYTPESSLNEIEFDVTESNMEFDGGLYPKTFKAGFEFSGKHVDLDLERNDLIDLEFPIIFLEEDNGVSVPDMSLIEKETIAFYRDKKRGVALSATKTDNVGGTFLLDGVIPVGNEVYEIKPSHDTQPLTKGKGEDFKQQRKLLSHRMTKVMFPSELTDEPVAPPVWTVKGGNESNWQEETSNGSTRFRRQATNTIDDYHVEMTLIVDHTVWEYWSARSANDAETTSSISQYMAHIVNAMSIPYSNIDLQQWKMRISLSVKNLVISKTNATSPWTTGNSIISTGGADPKQVVINGTKVLGKEGVWVAQDGRSWSNPDHAMLFTRYDIQGSVVGKAYVRAVCRPGLSVSVIEDRGYINYYVGAHELGHGLGSGHDGVSNTCDGDDIHIMAAGTPGKIPDDKLANLWTFSDCSIQQFKDVLGGTSGSFQYPRVCLTDRSCTSAGLPAVDLQPGLTTTLDQQCKLKYGEVSTLCQGSLFNATEMCRIIYCRTVPTGQGDRCYSVSPGAIDGTPCGTGMSCFRGNCIVTSDTTDTNTGDDACVVKPLSQPVPPGCADTPGYTLTITSLTASDVVADCALIIEDHPHFCLTHSRTKTSCCASCTQRGLVPPQMPVEGAWSTWGSWSSCSMACGDGTKERNRNCLPQDSICIGGETSESQECIGTTCPEDGRWSNWSAWSTCSQTCGTGSQSRTRNCTNPSPSNGDANCVGLGSGSQNCNTQVCPIDGGWSNWGAWSTCSQTCGTGSQARTRTCTNPSPSNGGVNCVGLGSGSQNCNTQVCPINGGWSNWSTWSTCSKTCGIGSQARTRNCTNPSSSNGDANCVGLGSGSQNCNTQVCPIDGGWSNWGAWSTCSQTCGSGSQARTRNCTNPSPSNSGANCVGLGSGSQDCFTQVCPINGVWSLWGQWSLCSRTCGPGTQTRRRSCTNPAPFNGGSDCVGLSSQNLHCNDGTCPTNGGWSSWGSWSQCSVTCGSGSQSRTRTCINPPPSNGGTECVGSSSDSLPCTRANCKGGSCVKRVSVLLVLLCLLYQQEAGHHDA